MQEITDYSCRGDTEFCFFYWSLFSKVKKLSELPEIDDWSAYIGRPLTTWSTVSYVECLRTEPLSFLFWLDALRLFASRSFERAGLWVHDGVPQSFKQFWDPGLSSGVELELLLP